MGKAKEETITRQGTKWVTKMYSKAGTVYKEENKDPEQVLVRVFDAEPAHVSVNLGMTVNLGNYESLRIDCGVTLPTYAEELEDAQQTAFRIALTELYKRTNEIKEKLAHGG